MNGQVSTSTGFDRIIQTTVLTIPAVTTDRIDLWNVNITAGVQSSVIQVTRSILPPPFTITDDQNPLSQDGVTHPPVTRTITPPPFPYPKSERIPIARTLDSTSPGGAFPAGSSTSTRSHPITTTSGNVFPYPTSSGYYYPPQDTGCPDCHDPPSITHSSAHPKKPCRTGCGHPCNPAVGLAAGIPVVGGIVSAAAAAALCQHPCYINCVGLGGFDDPIDPNPPGPPPGIGPDDSGSSGPGPNPGDPNDPESETTSSCSTSVVVTDYFVSCTSLTSGSVSCKTTSSSLSRGCDITASATTTTASNCALVTDNPDEDEGEDGDASLPSVSGRTTTTVAPVVTEFTPLPTHGTTTKTVEGTTTVVVPAPSPTFSQPYHEYLVGYWSQCLSDEASFGHGGKCVDYLYWGIIMRLNIPQNIDTSECNDGEPLVVLWQSQHYVQVTRGWPLDTGSIQQMFIGLDISSTQCTFSIPDNDTIVDVQCNNLPSGVSAPYCYRHGFNFHASLPDTCGPGHGWEFLATNICGVGKYTG